MAGRDRQTATAWFMQRLDESCESNNFSVWQIFVTGHGQAGQSEFDDPAEIRFERDVRGGMAKCGLAPIRRASDQLFGQRAVAEALRAVALRAQFPEELLCVFRSNDDVHFRRPAADLAAAFIHAFGSQ